MTDHRLIRKVRLRNYKGIAACDVELGQVSFLVGPNGSGKSNFMDALRFIADSLRHTVDHALRDRGGIREVRRRSSGHPTHFGMRVEFRLPDGCVGYYAFKIGARPGGAYEVQHEECRIANPAKAFEPDAHYLVRAGEVESTSLHPAPAGARDRLYLVALSGTPTFRPLYDALAGMGFYNLNPEEIRDLQSPDPGELLARDGGNITSVLAAMKRRNPALKKRIEEYLAEVVPGVSGVDPKVIGPKETLEFRQDVKGARDPWKFIAANMSDGTLRALGILIALFQGAANKNGTPRFVGIEEPEVALHPAATDVLLDSFSAASQHTQILVTSHSPDLLEKASIPDHEILAVIALSNETKIGPMDAAGRSALRDQLYTAGELLRMDQIRPDPTATELEADQLSLFGTSE